MQRSITQSTMQPLLLHPHPPLQSSVAIIPCDSHAQLFSRLMNRFACIASPFDNLPIDRAKADTVGFCPHANTPPLARGPLWPSFPLHLPFPCLLPCTACSCIPIFPMSCKSAFRYVEAADLAMRCGISAARELERDSEKERKRESVLGEGGRERGRRV